MKLERQFEKQLAGDLRKETADKIKEARKEPSTVDDLNKLKKEEKYKIQDLENSGWFQHTEDLRNIQKNIFGKIFKTEKYKEQEAVVNEILNKRRKSNIEIIQSEYKKKIDEIIKNCSLTEKERNKYLSTEAMEKMNLEDYLTLLKRLSGEAFYHVTRYGVRENTFMSTGGGHTAGKGYFLDSLTPLLKDGYIKSATSTLVENPGIAKNKIEKEEVLNLKKMGLSVEEIIEKIMKEYKNDYILDRESTHFSYAFYKHHMYGSEDKYIFYFYYPVEYIIQNDFYHTNRQSGLEVGEGYLYKESSIQQQYNDVSIFNFGKGVPVNAGILCISGDVDVDQVTGSQYLIKDGKPELDENGNFKKPEKTISSKEYWENYFINHPEIKPSKIIYGEFSTYAHDKNDDLKKMADSKEIYKQTKDKKKEFEKYSKETMAFAKDIFKKVVEEYYEEK